MKLFRLSVLSAAFLAAVCLSSTANAQRGGFRGGFGGGGLTQILGIEGVDKELELTEEQQNNIKSLTAEIQKGRQESSGNFDYRNASEDERAEFRQKMEKVAADISKKEKEQLGDILLKHQMERLEELRIQRTGIGALSDPAVIEKLDISKDQQAKIQAVQEGIQTKMREARSGGGGFNREQFQKLREDSDKEILAVLDSSQQKTFEKMKGETFEFPQRQSGGRGQGGGRPQGGRPQGGTPLQGD